eukprot:353211-Chlamydomonas_euryale.AAC.4
MLTNECTVVTNVTIPGLAAYYAFLVLQVLAMRERTPQVRNAIRHPFYEIVNISNITDLSKQGCGSR